MRYGAGVDVWLIHVFTLCVIVFAMYRATRMHHGHEFGTRVERVDTDYYRSILFITQLGK
jgi:fumarate reductase subunit D